MTIWNYNETDYEPVDYSILPVGSYRVRIADVNVRKFSSGNDGFEIIMDVSGVNNKLWYYLVLTPDNPKQTNQRLGMFFDCFGITDKNVDTGKQWKGKVGAVRVKHEAYKDTVAAKIQYLVSQKQQNELPAWVEPTKPYTNQVSSAQSSPAAASPIQQQLPGIPDMPDVSSAGMAPHVAAAPTTIPPATPTAPPATTQTTVPAGFKPIAYPPDSDLPF